MKPITSEVFQVGGDGLTSPQDAAVYLINVGDQSVLIDSGCGFDNQRLLANLETLNVGKSQVQQILLTHCHFDHSGGAAWLRDKLGCKIVAHELDAEYLEKGDNAVTAADWYQAEIAPFTIDRKLKEPREYITIDERSVVAYHVPGHSPGSVVYLFQSDDKKVMFGQDVHGPLHHTLLSDLDDYRKSLTFMISLEADILCEGHFGIITGKSNVAEFIRSYL